MNSLVSLIIWKLSSDVQQMHMLMLYTYLHLHAYFSLHVYVDYIIAYMTIEFHCRLHQHNGSHHCQYYFNYVLITYARKYNVRVRIRIWTVLHHTLLHIHTYICICRYRLCIAICFQLSITNLLLIVASFLLYLLSFYFFFI